ncbi:CHAT domain-containing protein [Qipengyuania sp. MTN3-11]
MCQVQDRTVGNPAARTSFDRAWSVVCRDSALPVASVYAFRGELADPVGHIAPFRREAVDCEARRVATAANVPGADFQVCTIADGSLDWSTIVLRRGDTTYVADGFSAYDSATLLALRSVIENRIAEGRIDAATTSVADPVAFSRIQAETLEPDQALTEGYRRNLGGDYAEAAAYFETLQNRLEREGDSSIDPVEFLVNRALQKSNLGEFPEAERLFAQARQSTSGDPIGERLQRNFEAMHQLNRGRPAEAIARLDQPLTAGFAGLTVSGDRLEITIPIAARLNADRRSGVTGISSDTALTPRERVAIIDAQARQLRGTALRLLGDYDAARIEFLDALNEAQSVRDGRVTTLARMRAQILGGLGLVAEAQGDPEQAETYLRHGLELVEAQYPERVAVASAKAGLANFLLRNGGGDEGRRLYAELVARATGSGAAATGFENQMAPYFRDLIERMDSDPAAAPAFFDAAQLLVRPGVAETQAVLARELSGGSDEASRLFRQSVDLTREIEQLRVRNLALQRNRENAGADAEMAGLEQRIAELEAAQVRTQAQLADYAQYRAVSQRAVTLPQFQQLLGEGEAYVRLALVGDRVLAFYADRGFATAYDTGLSDVDLDVLVDLIRASISIQEGGQNVTYPFDLESSQRLYTALLGPVDDRLGTVRHLVFEPDGAMLRLPVDLLVTDANAVVTHERRLERPDADPYDFTGMTWLGRDRMISTATSAQAFIDARQVRSSNASREYLGMGRNLPVGEDPPETVRAVLASGSDSCGWTAVEWNRPIDEAELVTARAIIGDSGSELLTGAQFTDTALRSKPDLDQYRILHFATHGLVTPPRPECAIKPALLTSFGAEGSDGLLTFDEVFDLGIDADVVILSACDTAGSASVEATRAAGLTSGGGTALDGLVRSFIGAGGRAVLASHWPAPDDYRATERLMSEMFRAGRDAPIGAALKQSQKALMDDPTTSHPYYWSGFALIGDAARPLLAQRSAPVAQTTTTAAE